MASTTRKLGASELDELERTLVECAAEHYFAEAFEASLFHWFRAEWIVTFRQADAITALP